MTDFLENIKRMESAKQQAHLRGKNIRYPADIVGKDHLFIAESKKDADMANSKGLPCVAFDRDDIRYDDAIQELIELCKSFKQVYFIGHPFAQERISTIGISLATAGIPICIVMLPEENLIVGDNLCHYLQSNTVEKFNELVNQAKPLIDSLIKGLPKFFQKAVPFIRENIVPLLENLDPPSRKHYIGMIAKQVSTKVKIIEGMVNDILQTNYSDQGVTEAVEEQFSPEVLAMAVELANNPRLLKMLIDAVNNAGVVGERKNIAVIICTITSRLLLSGGKPGQNVLATKIAGHQGAGKSYVLSICLIFFPASAYILITSGSEKSLYYMQSDFKHKCLIVAEAFQLSGNKGDTDIIYIIRTLLSEGRVDRLTTVKDSNGNFVSKKIELEGPVSFITTTIESGLEAQLDDRLVTIHPDDSISQTKMIVDNSAKLASGQYQTHDENITQVWRAYHQSLEPVSVLIPFATVISNSLNKSKVLPINARRAFNKVLNFIQVIACLYQYQRDRDSNGNVIATIADYSMALQIVRESFSENLGQLPKGTDQKLDHISSIGHTSIKDMANHFGVSRQSISKWVKKLEADGILKWVSDTGADFQDDKAMNLAKKSGKAHVLINEQPTEPWSSLGLPSPEEVDSSWQSTNSDYSLYDLQLDSVPTQVQKASDISVADDPMDDFAKVDVPDMADDSMDDFGIDDRSDMADASGYDDLI